MNFNRNLNEIINSPDLSTRSIQLNDELSPDIWEDDKLKPEVRRMLLKISKEFIKFLKLDTLIFKDIILTGSLANYNWTVFSDIDLHILVDFSIIGNDNDFVKEFFNAKKGLWNTSFNLEIKGHDVELYVQDINEQHKSSGVFSIYNNSWVVKPLQQMVVIDRVAIQAKAQEIAQEIDEIFQYDNVEIRDQIRRLKLKIKKMRQSGLENSGEYSVENLSFKILRNTGYLQKLSTLDQQSLESELSLENVSMYTPDIDAHHQAPEILPGDDPMLNEDGENEFVRNSKIKSTLYHGTSPQKGAKIREHGFNYKYVSSHRREEGILGIHFHMNKEWAKKYGPDVIPVKVNLQNPITQSPYFDVFAELEREGFDSPGKYNERGEKWSPKISYDNKGNTQYGADVYKDADKYPIVKGEKFIRELKRRLVAKGYDGIGGDRMAEIVVFDPEDIMIVKENLSPV